VNADEIRAQVTAALTAPGFGPTADDVADRLRALEIKGMSKDCSRCPIAVYLRQLPDLAGELFEVDTERVTILTGHGIVAEVPMPEPMSWFVQRFDHGVYLDLVIPGGGA
jgi:hypothetical protein